MARGDFVVVRHTIKVVRDTIKFEIPKAMLDSGRSTKRRR